jgi:hypothetical protein
MMCEPSSKKNFTLSLILKNKMPLTVEQTCRRLDNRLDTPLLFEGRPVQLRPRGSVCRQLYRLWTLRNDQVLDYESFKDALRFRLTRDLTEVTMARDLIPWIASGLTGGLGIAALYYLNSKQASKQLSLLIPDSDNSLVKADPWPALFRNAGNSCYFHAAMQMIYQMKDWFMDTQPAANDVDASQFKPKYKGQIDPLAFVGHAAKILDELKSLITCMQQYEILEQHVFGATYQTVTNYFLPNSPPGQQQDANDFLVKLFQCIQDVSAISIRRHSTKLISRKLLPWTCGGEEIPIDVMTEFYLTNPSKPISDYTFDSSRNAIRLKAKDECSLETPAIIKQDIIDGQDVDRQEIDEDPANILKVPPQKQLCACVKKLFLPHVEFITCINKSIHERMQVACSKIVVQTPSTYLIVHVTFDPDQCPSNFTVDWCRDIEIHQHLFDLICVIYKTGCRESGHYTASLKIDDEWKFYDDTAQTVQAIGGPDPPGAKKALPLMLLFKRR